MSLSAQVSDTGLECLPRLQACSQQEQLPTSCLRLPRTVWGKGSSPKTTFVVVFAIVLQQACTTIPLQGHHPCSSHSLEEEGSPAAQLPHRGLNKTKQNAGGRSHFLNEAVNFKFPLTSFSNIW